jgi:UDP-N-acetylglucosamine diphosphorylase/glucosamine-1-phosphate N-acetyltransferase
LWQYFGATSLGVVVRPHLAELVRQQYPRLAVNDADWLADGPLALVNGLWLPPDEPVDLGSEPHAGFVGNDLAYIWAGREQASQFKGESVDALLAGWKKTLPNRPVQGHIVQFPWHLIDHNGVQIGRDLAGPLRTVLDKTLLQPAAAPLALLGPPERLLIEPSARIEPFVVADATRGPVVIDEGAVIASFTRLEGPCYIGPNSQVFGAKIRAGTTLGPWCRIGGEVECSIVHGYSNKYHDGFLGHSYVGEWVNLGAGTHNSDLRIDYGPVSVVIGRQSIATGKAKVGCFLGDHVKTGLGTLINTGSTVGAFVNLFPAGRLAPKFVPSFVNWTHGELTDGFPLETLLATAQEMMQRRHCLLTDAHRRLYTFLLEDTASTRQRVLRDARQRVRYA